MGSDAIVLDHEGADIAISSVESRIIEGVGLGSADNSTISASASMVQAFTTVQGLNGQMSSSLQFDLGKLRDIGLAFDSIDTIEQVFE